jgi:hypothetical protein
VFLEPLQKVAGRVAARKMCSVVVRDDRLSNAVKSLLMVLLSRLSMVPVDMSPAVANLSARTFKSLHPRKLVPLFRRLGALNMFPLSI